MAWTDERVEFLKKRWEEGHSASQIAEELGGATRNAVIGKINRLGLMGRTTNNRTASKRKTTYRNVTRKPTPQHWPKNINMKPTDRPPATAIHAILHPKTPLETVPLTEVSDTQCRYPYRKNGKPVYCGKTVVPGTRWCPACYSRTHQKDSAGPKARQLEAAQ